MKTTFRPLRPKGSKCSLAAIKDAYMARRAMHNDMGVQCSVKPRSLVADPIRIQTKNTARHMCLLVTLTFRLAVQRCSAHYAIQQCLLSRSDYTRDWGHAFHKSTSLCTCLIPLTSRFSSHLLLLSTPHLVCLQL